MIWANSKMSTYVCHKFPIRLENLEGGLQDCDHELPQFAACRLRDGDVGQIAEYVVNLLAFCYELVHGQHAVFHNHLEVLFGLYRVLVPEREGLRS